MYADSSMPLVAHQPIRRRGAGSTFGAGARALAFRLSIVAAVVVFLVFALAQSVHGSGPGGYTEVTVAPGDTVWSIAAARYPGEDTRQHVDDILAANGLRAPVIQPGQRLRVPDHS